DGLLQEEMQGQADAGQRRLQLVAGGGDQVALDLVEQAEARNVLQQDGRAERLAVGVADRQDARQEVALLGAVAQREGALERVGQVRPLLVQGLAQGGGQGRRRLPRRGG